MDRMGSLGAFVQAAEARSFVKAGRHLGLSASAVGKAVARLEDRLGVRLFHRSTRSITLTAEGTLFLDRCRRIMAEVEAAEQELSQSHDVPRGRLKVTLPMAGGLMMPAIAGFMRAYPAIALDIDFTDRMVDLIEEGFDVAVRGGPVSDSRLMSRVLGGFGYRVVASPAYFAAHEPPAVPADLLGHACLHHRFPTSGRLRVWPLRDLPPEELPSAAVANAVEPIIYLAEQGFGIACLPAFTVGRQLAEGRLVAALDAFQEQGIAVMRVIWPSSRHLSPRLRAFVDYLARHMPSELAG